MGAIRVFRGALPGCLNAGCVHLQSVCRFMQNKHKLGVPPAPSTNLCVYCCRATVCAWVMVVCHAVWEQIASRLFIWCKYTHCH
jgi:hypothetical protein